MVSRGAGRATGVWPCAPSRSVGTAHPGIHVAHGDAPQPCTVPPTRPTPPTLHTQHPRHPTTKHKPVPMTPPDAAHRAHALASPSNYRSNTTFTSAPKDTATSQYDASACLRPQCVAAVVAIAPSLCWLHVILPCCATMRALQDAFTDEYPAYLTLPHRWTRLPYITPAFRSLASSVLARQAAHPSAYPVPQRFYDGVKREWYAGYDPESDVVTLGATEAANARAMAPMS